MLRLSVRLEPFATVCFWITRHDPLPIDPPSNLRIRSAASETDVQWDAVNHPQLLGYDAQRIDENGQVLLLTLRPIRPVMVTDEPSPGVATYRVRSVTCSGMTSAWVSVTQAIAE